MKGNMEKIIALAKQEPTTICYGIIEKEEGENK